MIAAVGSNARCGSDVLISNERSTTSVGAAAVRAVAPNAATAEASAAIAASGRSRFTVPSSGVVDLDPIRRARPWRVGQRTRGLEPAGGRTAVGQRDEGRLLLGA